MMAALLLYSLNTFNNVSTPFDSPNLALFSAGMRTERQNQKQCMDDLSWI